LAKLTDGHFTVFNTEDGLAGNKLYTLRAAQNGDLFIGTRHGLSIYNGQRFSGIDAPFLSNSRVLSIYREEATGDWWLGTYGEGVFEYDDGSIRRLTEQDGLASNIVIAIEQAADGAHWFATYGGVSRFKNGTFTNYTIQNGLPNNGVLDILRDKSGDMWFATFGGLAHFKNEKIQSITAEDGLPDEVCYFIEQDDRGIFWIGTNKGLVRFDYAAYQLGEQSPELRPFKLMTEDQGLAGNEMNAGASFKDRSGNLWFGSMGGLTQLISSADMINKAAPRIHIESINISGEEIPIQRDLEIASSNRNITISFIGINFTAPKQVEYKYRLKNSGEGWQTTNRREVRYSALIPGEYTFEVKAQNNDGRWSRQNAQISFEVLAPFWLRWWFIALVLLALLGIVVLFYNYYRVRKMVDIERMRVRIASDLHDDVGSTLTEIALQSDFLQTMDVDDSLEESLQQIGTQSRKIVSSLDDIVWSIDARNDTVGDLTDRMQDYANSVLPKKRVRYSFEGDMQEKLQVSLKENVYLIFKEAVNNIAKHSNADKVEIRLTADGSYFTMSIKDNGKGSGSGRKTGQGLRNMNMRAKRIDADITFRNNEGFEVRVSNRK
ncbi:MAG TPA: two-component regulator propeller domain-containing protein, partial [Fodinibius sp.]|nr:two-component regulator propeller domain-containing protein [Fodinibius sp.]